MFKNFNELKIGSFFFNSFTNTRCLKISDAKYFDLDLKHTIKMKQYLREHKHPEIILKVLTYYEKGE